MVSGGRILPRNKSGVGSLPMSLRFRVVFALSCAVLTLLAFTSYAGQVRAEAEKVRSDAIARYGGEVVSLVVTNRQI